MTQSDLDDLLSRSTPYVERSGLIDQEAVRLARSAIAAGPGKRARTKLLAVVAATLAALTLGVGTAFAAPIPAQWWLWSPENDLITVSEPFTADGTVFQPEGEAIVCTMRTRVLTDAQTATLNTVIRLYQARAFLQAVDTSDYEDAALALYADGGDTPMPYEFDHQQALVMAIEQDAAKRGLNGQGVSIETAGLCLPAQ